MKKGTFIFSTLLLALAFTSLAFSPAPINTKKVVWTQVVHLDASLAGSASAAQGLTIFKLTSDGVLSYKIIVQKLEDDDALTAGHIHFGGVGMNGGVAIDLSAGVRDLGQFQTLQLTAAQFDLLMNQDQGLYVNLHSMTYPSGVIRGQIR